jgi:hypothetical protein
MEGTRKTKCIKPNIAEILMHYLTSDKKIICYTTVIYPNPAGQRGFMHCSIRAVNTNFEALVLFEYSIIF